MFHILKNKCFFEMLCVGVNFAIPRERGRGFFVFLSHIFVPLELDRLITGEKLPLPLSLSPKFYTVG